MKPLPVPADFAAQAAIMHRAALVRHYAISWTALDRMIALTGIQPLKTSPFGPDTQPAMRGRPVPADLADMAGKMTRTELQAHYVCHDETLRRWLKATGIEPQPYVRAAHTVRRRPRYNITPTAGRGSRLKIERVTTQHEDAADVLRRFGPVYRCDDNGAANPHGKLWRIGCGFPITGDELLARAERHRRKAA